MKRMIALVLFVLLAAGCAAKPEGSMASLDRAALLPDDTVAGIMGGTMKQALDERDESTGVVRWAWEETDGIPKLLVVEVHFAPADCDALYNRAQSGQGAAALAVPQQAVACNDGRAAHVRFGEYYVRIATLGISDEKGAGERVAARLVLALSTKK